MSIRKSLCIGTITLSMLTTGCLVGGGSTTRREGNYVSQSTLSNIETGKTTKAWIVATLGEPTTKIVLEPGHELWKYSYKETKESGGFVFLLYAGGDTKIADGTVFVEMQNSIVTKTWRG
jgi:outer membrane protein assembly factor BamE (lipoprotein component of BamABCDE complex)